jgi:hypothetical protein
MLPAWATAAWMREHVLAGMLVAWHCGQEELRRPVGAAAFHQRFATNLSMLLGDARSALAELHLTVSSLLPCHRHHSESAAAAAGQHEAVPDGAGDVAAAEGAAQTAKRALGRAAACHGNLPLGRLRQSPRRADFVL